jgi:hypothetical protein
VSFDQVLSLASGAIEPVIKPFGISVWQVGDDVADVGAGPNPTPETRKLSTPRILPPRPL